MNRKIGMVASLVNLTAVVGFALSMLLGSNFFSYLSSVIIAFSFVPMMGAFFVFAKTEAKLSGLAAISFSVMYAVVNSIVYFTQMTTVRIGGLTEEASNILDFQKFGLFFSLDMLGYALMSLATFFAGLSIKALSKPAKWLKALLLIHGLFFLTCFLVPMFPLFTPGMEGADWIGVSILTFWCVYFAPVSALTFFHFSKSKE